jgi:hypothetical protein
VGREAIEGENRINESNHDDHDMIYGNDEESHSESSQYDGDNKIIKKLMEINKIIKKLMVISKTIKSQIKQEEVKE